LEGRTIRIAVVHSFYSFSQPSGENVAVEAEVKALRGAGHEVELFAARTDDFNASVLHPIRSGIRVATGGGRSPLRALRAFGPDLVQIHNLFPNFSRRWVRKVDVPVITTLHNYRSLCANGLLYRDGHICTLCPDGARWSGLRHACYRDSRAATLPLTWANRKGPLADPVLGRADRIVVLSDLQQRIFVGAGVPPERLTVLPHFLPHELDPGTAQHQDADRTAWLAVGRLDRQKGIVELVRRWPKRRALVVVGDGPLSDEVRRTARGTNVSLVGASSRDQVMRAMGTARGLVYPSQSYETFGLVYVEALAAGIPVLALGDNVVAEQVKVDGTGWRLGLHDDLEEPLAVFEQTAPSLRARCRQIFEQRYSEREHIRAFNALVSQLLTPSEAHPYSRRAATRIGINRAT
jgi:glycosyltransferase involved in cell wall biosynthesis